MSQAAKPLVRHGQGQPVSALDRADKLTAMKRKPLTRSSPFAKVAPTSVRHAHAAQEVRIVGGMWKRTPLPVADVPGLRPTPGRVRETLFNWLGQDLTGWRCVDAFAGTGALGLEAASRGAAEVVLIEHSAALIDSLRQTLIKLQAKHVRLDRADALTTLRRMAGQNWDVVFLDPPFLQGDNEAVFQHALQAAAQVVSPTGLVYLESPRAWTDAELAALGLVATRRARAGVVHHSLLQRLGAEPALAQLPGTPAGE